MPYTLKPNKIFVKDPEHEGYLPQNVIADATTAEQVTAVNAAGASQINNIMTTGASILENIEDYDVPAVGQEVDDLKSAFDFNAFIANNGEYTISASAFEQGSWSYSTKSANTKRIRCKFLIPVSKGMVVTYTNPTLDIYIGRLATPTSESYAKNGSWVSPQSGSLAYVANGDGYLTVILKDPNGADITPANYDCTIMIESLIKQNTQQLKDCIDYPYGALPSGSDVDDVSTNGMWWVSTANSYLHLPDGMTNGVLINRCAFPTSDTVRLQIAYNNVNNKVYFRYRTSNGFGAWNNNVDEKSYYGELYSQTGTSRSFSIDRPLEPNERISVGIRTWTGPTPSAVRLYASEDGGSTYSQKVVVNSINDWMTFTADKAYTSIRVGMVIDDPLTENATIDIIITPYRQDVLPQAVSIYGKKILLGGASIVQGYGGTGYAMDGETIIDISGTSEGESYSSHGLWKRNTSGYCWANLFKELVEQNYDCILDNNGCQGTNVVFWKNHADTLIPSGYDLFIYTMSSNDRNYAPETCRINIKNGIEAMYRRCQSLGTVMIVLSPPPASQANEAGKLTQTWQCNEFVKEACNELGILYLDLHNTIIKYYFDHGAETAGTYIADGLHPNDDMYYRMYFCYCWLLNVSPTTAYAPPPV